ncbi:MAG: M1 family metallopeptidase [Chloroflexi bacterium]|nr:M1 family metallopeptidase [Chloroflexota bacterium]
MTTSDHSLLLSNVRPRKYRITLTPDLEAFTFQGEETIDISVVEPTSEIALNAVEIEVQSARVVHPDGTATAASQISYDETNETATFRFPTPLRTGPAQLFISFAGRLNDRLHGFYRSTYRSPEGQTRTMAATQFEATDARRAFPCWDEPALKATFQVDLVIPARLTAVSNAPVTKESPAPGGRKRLQFAETPVMSTYLLAFIVGELEFVEARAAAGTLVRVGAVPGKRDQGRFALDIAVRLLSYYNDYFGVPYPLPKLDHLAIPDFAAGAMENWGVITYRETALLFDPQNSAPATRQRVAEVVAHEMAHMWFGDLVTMAWWNDLWLNESFASWMATKAIDHLFPEWDMWTQFVLSDVNAGLGLDGLENSHPIEASVRKPSEVNQLFDAISYSKGASILRMLEQFLEPDTFRDGLRLYISRHQYGNAQTSDLWQALEEASGQPVRAIMDSWVKQTGYPVVRADVRRRGRGAQVNFSQQRFLYTGAEADQNVWQVPISVSGAGASESDSLLLTTREAPLRLKRALPRPGSGGWVKANAGETGFFRVLYAEKEWARLIAAVTAQEMSAPDRLGLEEDAFALARAGLLSAIQYLDLTDAYKGEQDLSVWANLAGHLREIDLLLAQEPCSERFQSFGRGLLETIVKKVGWRPKSGEGHLQTLLRSTVLGVSGALGDSKVLQEARGRFQRYLDDRSSLIPDLRAVVYTLAARTGDGETYEILRGLAREAPLHEEKVRLHMALAAFAQKDLLKKTLELSLSPEEVRSQDTVALVSAVAYNRNGREPAWEYVKSNWPEFKRRYGSGGFQVMRLVAITGNFTTLEAKRDVEEFFQRNPAPAATRAIQQSLERITLNARWLERNRQEVAEWLAAR